MGGWGVPHGCGPPQADGAAAREAARRAAACGRDGALGQGWGQVRDGVDVVVAPVARVKVPRTGLHGVASPAFEGACPAGHLHTHHDTSPLISRGGAGGNSFGGRAGAADPFSASIAARRASGNGESAARSMVSKAELPGSARRLTERLSVSATTGRTSRVCPSSPGPVPSSTRSWGHPGTQPVPQQPEPEQQQRTQPYERPGSARSPALAAQVHPVPERLLRYASSLGSHTGLSVSDCRPVRAGKVRGGPR